ncbi:hypothetical protein ACWDA3_58255 [Nonomuraea rubra]
MPSTASTGTSSGAGRTSTSSPTSAASTLAATKRRSVSNGVRPPP